MKLHFKSIRINQDTIDAKYTKSENKNMLDMYILSLPILAICFAFTNVLFTLR